MSKNIITISPDGTVTYSEPYTSVTELVAEDFTGTISRIIVNEDVSPITVISSGNSQSINVNPMTEQFISGYKYGDFKINETVVQSCMSTGIVNGYSTRDFIPTVTTVGVSGAIGKGVAHFKGNYLDNPALKGAGLCLPPFSTSNANTPYFLIKGWIYDYSNISAYDPIIVTRSADGVTPSTNDSFLLEWDNSTKRFLFNYSTVSYVTAGWEGSIYVSPSNPDQGVWHQFAVGVVSSGGSAAIKTYWDGQNIASTTGLCGCLRNSTAALMVGSGRCGDLPCRYYIDDFHVMTGTSSAALAEFSNFSSATTNGYSAWTQDASSIYTVYYMSMNGPNANSFFPVENKCRVTGRVSFLDPPHQGRSGASLGVALVIREQEAPSYLGYSLFSGVCSGFSASGSNGISAGYVFGCDSGACIVVDGVQQLRSFSQLQAVRKSAMDYSKAYAYGACAMSGICASTGNFPYLFSGGWSGGMSFSYLPTQENLDRLKSLYDNITVVGYSGPTVIETHTGIPYSFLTVDVINLYKDVIAFRADMDLIATSVKSQIQGVSLFNNLLSIKGYSSQGYAVKYAPSISVAGSLYIDPVAAITKETTAPQKRYNDSSKYVPLKNPEPF